MVQGSSYLKVQRGENRESRDEAKSLAATIRGWVWIASSGGLLGRNKGQGKI